MRLVALIVVGAASIHKAYDTRGNVTEESYFGTKLEPVVNPEPVEISSFQLLTARVALPGYRVIATIFLVDNSFGSARVKRAYDGRGNLCAALSCISCAGFRKGSGR